LSGLILMPANPITKGIVMNGSKNYLLSITCQIYVP
jgi:hypothetical protein